MSGGFSDEISLLYNEMRTAHILFKLGMIQESTDMESDSESNQMSELSSPKTMAQRANSVLSKTGKGCESAMVVCCNSRANNNAVSSKTSDCFWDLIQCDACCDEYVCCEGGPKRGQQSSRARRTAVAQRRSTAFMYLPRENRFAKWYDALVTSPQYKVFSGIVAVVALFITDLTYAFLPKDSDFVMFNILLTFIFAFLCLELILYSATHRGYVFTFFFWLDIVGTLSLLLDVPWVMLGVGLNSHVFLIVKGGKMGRAVRSVGSARFIKLLKMVRMMKLFRVVQIFKRNRPGQQASDEQDSPMQAQPADSAFSGGKVIDDEQSDPEKWSHIKPSRMGSLLADKVTQKVILGVLVSFLVLPLFDSSPQQTFSHIFQGLNTLQYQFQNFRETNSSTISSSYEGVYNNTLDNFYDVTPRIIFLRISDPDSSDNSIFRIESENEDKLKNLREAEKISFEISRGRTKVTVDIRKQVQNEALLTIGLTMFIIAIFSLGSVVISYDTMLLIHPLEYLVVVLKKLTQIAVKAYVDSDDSSTKNASANDSVTSPQLYRCILDSMVDVFYDPESISGFIQRIERLDQSDDSESMDEQLSNRAQSKGRRQTRVSFAVPQDGPIITSSVEPAKKQTIEVKSATDEGSTIHVEKYHVQSDISPNVTDSQEHYHNTNEDDNYDQV